ncbi:MAG: hypothetical protein JO199_09140 [Candidatus Eremiobacteraeota bacterium]|nr:hypothetical protein [Candidatus Eremiobacteraeota bacterium]
MNDTQLTPLQQSQIETILQDAWNHGLTLQQVQNQIDRVIESSKQQTAS